MKNIKLFSRAALHSLGILAYIFLVAYIMNNGEHLFGMGDNGLIGPIAILLLFVFSALVTAFLALGKPVMLYLDGQKKEGIKMLGYTVLSLFVLLAIFFLVSFLMK